MKFNINCGAFSRSRRQKRPSPPCFGDGSVVAWGDAGYGGDASAVQHLLSTNVCKIQASSAAFAAIFGDGAVATWGHITLGGDSIPVRRKLRKVRDIQASDGAFAAICLDGSVVTWGHPRFGGDSVLVEQQLKGVQQIQATGCTFAAILTNGSVVAWGVDGSGGDASLVPEGLQKRSAASSFDASVRRHLIHWLCGNMGLCFTWRRQLSRTGAASRCAANSSHTRTQRSVCCYPCRWICRGLGRQAFWR